MEVKRSEWIKMRRFAFLAQIIIKVLTGDSVGIDELIGEYPIEETKETDIDNETAKEWIIWAKQNGLEYKKIGNKIVISAF